MKLVTSLLLRISIHERFAALIFLMLKLLTLHQLQSSIPLVGTLPRRPQKSFLPPHDKGSKLVSAFLTVLGLLCNLEALIA